MVDNNNFFADISYRRQLLRYHKKNIGTYIYYPINNHMWYVLTYDCCGRGSKKYRVKDSESSKHGKHVCGEMIA